MSQASQQPISRRIVALVAFVALAVLALGAAGCGGDDDDEGAGTTPAASQPQEVTVEVKDAEPVGGIVRADIKQGTEVMLKVTSDVEDEVHVHGYDLSAEVAPDQPAHISFKADIAGEFEVELEERTVPIAELTVAP
jgi:nitrous oxide reductase